MTVFSRRFMLLVAPLLTAGAIGCTDLGPEPTIEDLEVRYLVGSISANMMPVVPPAPNDRIRCSLDLLVRNTSGRELHTTLRVLRADLRRAGTTRTRLGTLYFSTDWDGVLGPGQADTLRLVKRQLSQDFLQPECGATVVLDLEIGEGEEHLLRLSTDQLELGCLH